MEANFELVKSIKLCTNAVQRATWKGFHDSAFQCNVMWCYFKEGCCWRKEQENKFHCEASFLCTCMNSVKQRNQPYFICRCSHAIKFIYLLLSSAALHRLHRSVSITLHSYKWKYYSMPSITCSFLQKQIHHFLSSIEATESKETHAVSYTTFLYTTTDAQWCSRRSNLRFHLFDGLLKCGSVSLLNCLLVMHACIHFRTV